MAMKKMVIVGAGGLGRQVLAQLLVDFGHGREWLVGGFIDERGPDTVSPELGFPWLGTPDDFLVTDEYIFVSAIGDPSMRRRQVESLEARGAEFVAIRTRCQIGARTNWGPTFFGYDVSCGVDSNIGRHAFLDQDVLIGHDVTIGDFVHVGPRCFIGGYAQIGEGAVLNPGSMIGRKVRIGAGAVVGLGAVVLGNVPPGVTVIGNPARRFDFRASE